MQSTSLSLSKKVNAKWKWLNFIDWLLPAYIVCTIPLLFFGWNYDFLFKGVAIFSTILYTLRFKLLQNKVFNIFTLFVLVVTFSFVQYLYNDRPIVCYFTEVSNYVATMLFFYVGASDDRPGKTFYHRFMIVMTVVFVIGLYYYLTTPGWYLSRNLEFINSTSAAQYNESNMLEKFRFSAFFGDSYPVSHFSVFCVAIAIFDIVYKKGKNKLLAIACLLVGVVSSFACMHRASILGCVLSLLVIMFFNHKMGRYRYNLLIFVISLIMLAGLVSFSYTLTDRLDDLLGMLTERVDDNMSLNKALSERKFTKELMDSMQFFIFGHGLGSGGGSVRAYGFPGITDMQYIKMFFENGIVGAVLFIGIMVRALRRGIKDIQYYMTEVSIILFILVAMLGSNSLSIYYFIVFPFWYAVGRLYNNQYHQRLKNSEWKY